MTSRMLIAALAALLTACDGGPSDSEFHAACLNEGKAGANKAMRREMGLDGEAFCKCVTKEARTQVSAEGRQAMMLDMLGRTQEARAISAKMDAAAQEAMLKGGLGVMQACLGKAFGK
jgi:hypothetical protein